MKNAKELKEGLIRVNNRPYPFYKDLKGKYDFGDYVFSIDHVQSDPYASPSRVSVFVKDAGIPEEYEENAADRTALEDQLLRFFGSCVREEGAGGKKGGISVSRPGQEVLGRTSCTVDPQTGSVTVRFHIGFPAAGRKIKSQGLINLVFQSLPKIVKKSLIYESMGKRRQEILKETYELSQDQRAVRAALREKGLVSFVANGSILPRESGASDRPMADAVAFESPESMEVVLELPNRGEVKGMGIPEGITLIVGGGYHGKSTLLNALEMGVYNHIKGDGRELVITRDDGMKIRSEDGRSIHEEDISMFIQNLPRGKDTSRFSSEDASGSTSQASNTIEAIESGSKLLLIDEDTSATNFMVRDALMASVIHADEEPIIPFIERIQDLSKDHDISTILVAGSSGAFFDKADHIIQMKDYEPFEITKKAKKMAGQFKDEQAPAGQYGKAQLPVSRIPLKNKKLEEERVKVKTSGLDTVSVLREPIDIRYLEQLTDKEQLNTLGRILIYAQKNYINGERTLEEVLDLIEKDMREKGLDVLGHGELAQVRRQEIAGILNRWRFMQFKMKE